MFKTTLLDELKKKYLSENPMLGMADSYDVYKHKNGLNTSKSYSDAVNALYASTRKSLSNYGQNSRILNNKGLQNSGYSDYIDASAEERFDSEKNALKALYTDAEATNLGSYASYLEKYKEKQQSIKNNVLSHLVDSGITDLPTAIAYGINSGLSYDDAKAMGQSAYSVTKDKVTNEILKQSASLGLDRDGAKMLAIKMGMTTTDAEDRKSVV